MIVHYCSNIFMCSSFREWISCFSEQSGERVFSTSLFPPCRSAEITYSLALARSWHDGASASAKTLMNGMSQWLTEARRDLGLFQHHDGITGTGKAHVMEDYKAKYGHGGFACCRQLSAELDAARAFLLQSHPRSDLTAVIGRERERREEVKRHKKDWFDFLLDLC